jgi:glycosyltransferase involved in cell wall biosynthesis
MNKKANINKSAKKTAMINQQLVSVVMPSLNQVAYLELAIRSVLEQNHGSIELIVVDGLSRDGSQDLLMTLQKEYGERLRWISQVDSGPAQAINKALKMAQGSIIGWLNSDDMYTQGAVQRAVQHFQDRPDHLMVYGQAEHIDENRRVLGVYPTKPPSTPLDEFANGCFICQPTVFMRREALEHVGFLDESMKQAAIKGSLALVQSSYFESFSIVLCEAWVQARPALVQGASPVLRGQAERSGGAIAYEGLAGF